MNSLVDRFLRYVTLNTMSDPNSGSNPSTPGQMEMLELLREEVLRMGLEQVVLDERGVLYGMVPGGCDSLTIGLIAHVDTAPAVSGRAVKPVLHREWDGSPIRLAEGVILDPEQCPEMIRYRGGTIITSDGSTLLGADDKAGVAIIIEACRLLMSSPEKRRPRVAVAFTTDEEIGRGMDNFDPGVFRADFAYTVDGLQPGSVDSATFNAFRADWSITGVEVHPGSALGKLVNPVRIAGELVSMIRPEEMPENSGGDRGFDYPMEIRGGPENARVSMILRDFSMEGMNARLDRMRSLKEFLSRKHEGAVIELALESQYRNPAEILASDRRPVECALRATERVGLTPEETRIRGGTDGSRLSFLGVPTVNLPTGGGMFHSRREWVSAEGMKLCLDIVTGTVFCWGDVMG